MKNAFISKEVQEELDLFASYIEYRIKNQIKLGNANWIIIDSSKENYKHVLNEIINITKKYEISVTQRFGADFSSKSGTDYNEIENSLLDNYTIKYSLLSKRDWDDISKDPSDNYFTRKIKCNVIIVGNIDFQNVINRYAGKAMFLVDLDTNSNSNSGFGINKKELIMQLAFEHGLKFDDDIDMSSLLNLENGRLENELTRIFVKTLNNNSTTISNKDISLTGKTFVNDHVEELNSLIGLKQTKETLLSIMNYLLVSKNRSDVPSLHMAFLGNPRNW